MRRHPYGRAVRSSMVLWLSAVCLVAGLPCHALAQEAEVGRVTLLTGTPRMPGQSLRRAAPVLSGRPVQTGPEDAVGVLMQDVVVHVGVDAEVTFDTVDGVTHIRVNSGLLAFYHDEQLAQRIVVATPFGQLTPTQTEAAEGAGLKSGAYTVRHDPERPGIAPATSTFSALEGAAQVEGITPKAGPHALAAGHKWIIREGQVPGGPVDGDEATAARDLSNLLHRETIEALRPDVALLAPDTDFEIEVPPLLQVSAPAGQDIIEVDDIARLVAAPPIIRPDLEDLRLQLTPPALIPAGDAVYGEGDFVYYDGIVRNPDFNRFLVAVNESPAYRPQYVRELANAGLSYLQLAGSDARVRTAPTGEPFLAGERNGNTGWALYSPTFAVADGGFSAAHPALQVIDAAFGRIAQAGHLANGGTIGPSAGDNASAFATLVDIGGVQNVQLNPALPAGFPLLRRANETGGLEVGGEPIADQIAALGAGRDPLDLSLPGPRLTFLSDANVDANGNPFDFNGNPIAPTRVDLPGQRTVDVDRTGGVPTLAIPLAPSTDNTVGIQFAPTAGTENVVAIVHHDGTRPGPQGTFTVSDHFEIVRGGRFSIVRWRTDTRPTDAAGDPLEFEDLNGQVAIRDELFEVVSREVNLVVPPGSQTLFGPATVQTTVSAATRLVRGTERLTRPGGVLKRDPVVKERHGLMKDQLRQSRALQLGSGLRVSTPSGFERRYLGYNRVRN